MKIRGNPQEKFKFSKLLHFSGKRLVNTRMMAVLLAASMVVSSTGFTALADEITFDDGSVIEVDAAADQADFFVEDEEVVEDTVVEDGGFFVEDVVDDVVVEDQGFAVEEPVLEDGAQDILDLVDSASESADFAVETVEVTSKVISATITYGNALADMRVFYTINRSAAYYDENGTVVAGTTASGYTDVSAYLAAKDADHVNDYAIVDLDATPQLTAANIAEIGKVKFASNDWTQFPDAIGLFSVAVDATYSVVGSTKRYNFGAATGGTLTMEARPLKVKWSEDNIIPYSETAASYTYAYPTLSGVVNNDLNAEAYNVTTNPYGLVYTVTDPSGATDNYTVGANGWIVENKEANLGAWTVSVADWAGQVANKATCYTLVTTDKVYPTSTSFYIAGSKTATYTYDGTAKSIDVSGIDGSALQYQSYKNTQLDGSGTYNLLTSWTSVKPSFKDAGNYRVDVKFYKTINGVDKEVVIPYFCIIKQAKITAHLNDISFTYDSGDVLNTELLQKRAATALKNTSFTYTGLVGSDTAANVKLATGAGWNLFDVHYRYQEANGGTYGLCESETIATAAGTTNFEGVELKTVVGHPTKVATKDWAGATSMISTYNVGGPRKSGAAITERYANATGSGLGGTGDDTTHWVFNAGRYEVDMTGAASSIFSTDGNYEVKIEGVGYIVVAPQPITATWDSNDHLEYAGGNDVVYKGSGTDTDPKPAVGPSTETFTYSGIRHADAGEYTAKITGVTGADGSVINYTISDASKEHKWYILGKGVTIDLTGLTGTIPYGAEDPTKNFKAEEIKIYEFTDTTKAPIPLSKFEGTPVFTVENYNQYSPVGTEYKVTVSGLKSDEYEIKQTVAKTVKVTPANVTITPDDVLVGYGEAMPTLTYTLSDTVNGSGESAAVAHDLAAKKLTINLATTPAEPVARGSYPITATVKYADGANENFKFTTRQGNYVIGQNDFNLKVEDYKGAADGQAHGLVITPAVTSLPNTVKMYFSEKDYLGLLTNRTDAATAFKNENRTTEIKRTKVGTTKVYYYVESEEYGLNLFGNKSIVLYDNDEAAAAEAEKLMKEAATPDASGKYDKDKVAAARAAYDALSDYAKPLVSAATVKALEAAEAAVKKADDEAAAANVEGLIDALPAAADATAATKKDADAAKEAYDKLTDDQKSLVDPAKVTKLNDVKAAADKAAGDADKAAAKTVEDAIDALPAPADVKAADMDAINKAGALYDGLTDAQKLLVPAEKVTKLRNDAAAAEAAVDSEAKAAEDAINAIKNATPGKGKEATEAARKAYDDLTMASRAKVDADAVKDLAQAEKCYEKDATFTAGEGIYRVLSNGDVTYLKPTYPEKTYFQVPNDVKCPEGYSFKVVKVSTQAFKGCANVTKIWMGKNIVTIGAYVFKGATNLTKLIVRTQDITVPTKVTNAFVAGGKNKGAKLTVQVWDKMISTYEPMFRNEGGLNKDAKIVGGLK